MTQKISKTLKLKDLLKEVQNVPKIGDLFDLGNDFDFETVPIIRVNTQKKWIDIKHPKGRMHRIDIWNIETGGSKAGKKIWRAK